MWETIVTPELMGNIFTSGQSGSLDNGTGGADLGKLLGALGKSGAGAQPQQKGAPVVAAGKPPSQLQQTDLLGVLLKALQPQFIPTAGLGKGLFG